MNILRRMSLARLLLGCALTVVIGASLAALALALGTGPTPPAKPLAQAIHDALGGQRTEGFSADIKLTNRLFEGAELATGEGGEGGLASSPLLNGASGRIWISSDGRLRLELQAEQGDTQILWDGSTLQMYDAATNTLYRLKPDRHGQDMHARQRDDKRAAREAPSVAEVERAVKRLQEHAAVSGATPTDVGGQPAYTVRVAPREGGSLLAGAELSFDANRGWPLRAAIYSTQSSAPVIELAASNVSYSAVPDGVFDFSAPPDAKVEEVSLGKRSGGEHAHEKPKVTVHGHGPSAIAVVEQESHGSASSPLPEGLERVKVGAQTASVLKTELGTLLTFERAGVRYLVLGSVTPESVEALAREL